MRRTILIAILTLAFSTAYAGANCNGKGNCNDYDIDVDKSTTNKAYGGDGGNAYSKAYGGDGGDSYSKAYGGNAYSGSKSYSDAEAAAAAYAKQQQGQGQFQGNVGLGTGNKTQVVIQSKSTVDAQPAIAPGIAPGDPTAPCYVTMGGSAAGGGIASIGFSGYKYDTICGALEFYRTVGKDPAHSKDANKAVSVAYHNLMNRMWDEMGETEYNKATGDVVEDSGTTASHTYPTEDGGFMKVSFTKLGQPGVDVEEPSAFRTGGINGSQGR